MITHPISSIWSSLALALCFFAAPSSGQAQEVVEIHVSPETLSLKVGESQRLFLTAFDANGNIVAHGKHQFLYDDYGDLCAALAVAGKPTATDVVWGNLKKLYR